MKPMFLKFPTFCTTVALLVSCASQSSRIDLYGNAVPEAGANRTIVIRPNTKHVNVEGGETVRFIVGDKSFAWNFFIGRKTDSFALNDIAPPGILDHIVRVYVSPDPRYLGGSDRSH